jgi:NitT/TauT family transport system substrate-binding protein
MRPMKLFLSCLTVAAILLAAVPRPALAAEPLTIRIGWLLVPAEITPILFPEPGIAKHLGKSYVLKPIRFRGSPLLISALAANEIDVAPFGYSSFALAIENAHMSNLRIFADEDRDGVGGHFTTQYMIRKDSGIDKVEDLKGKVLATNAAGSIGDMAMRFMLKKHHLDAKKDTSSVEVAFPNMNAMLEGRKADLIISVLPFYLAPDLQKTARTLFTSKDALGPTEISMLTASQAFLQKNRAAVVDFLEDYLRALRWYNDPAHHDKAVATVAQFTKLPPKLFASWVFTGRDYYRAPEAKVDVAALQRNVDAQHELGFLKNPLDVKKYVDMSLVEEAVKRR